MSKHMEISHYYKSNTNHRKIYVCGHVGTIAYGWCMVGEDIKGKAVFIPNTQEDQWTQIERKDFINSLK